MFIAFRVKLFLALILVAHCTFNDTAYHQAFTSKLGLTSALQANGTGCYNNMNIPLDVLQSEVQTSTGNVSVTALNTWLQSLKTATQLQCEDYEFGLMNHIYTNSRVTNLRNSLCGSITSSNIRVQNLLSSWGTYYAAEDYLQAGEYQAYLYQVIFNTTNFVSPSFTYSRTNLAVRFNAAASSSLGASINSYAWNFGEPASATNVGSGSLPSHTYASAGTYNVSLTVTDELGVSVTTYRILTISSSNTAPTALFTATRNGLSVSFNGAVSSDADGAVTNYAWTFGEASSTTNTGSGMTASHTYAAAGSYSVVLVVTDDQGATGTITRTVVVAPANTDPVASFSITRNNLAVSFNGGASYDSDGSITNYAWNFGEAASSSNTATGSVVSHTYTSAGTYNVTLTVTDDQGATHTSTRSVLVTSANTNPVASFSYSKNYLVVSFNGGASTDPDGRVSNWVWNFGESSSGSNTATGATASHTYAAAGTYTVTLTVTDDQGATNVATRTVTVATTNLGPTAAFAFTSNDLQITFNAGTSTDNEGTIISYAWTFGEASSSSNTATGMTPVHVYGAAGSYTVTLTITNDRGATSTSTQTVPVTINGANPSATFRYTATNLVVAFDATASTTTTGTITGYSWNFGESSSSSNTATGSTPSHTYAAAGTYTVQLSVTNSAGQTTTTTRSVTVVVNSSPVATFTVTKTNLAATFNGGSSLDSDGTIVSYAWNFGESSSASNTATSSVATHTYAAAGTYQVTLTVTDNQGATNTRTQSVTVSAANTNPVASFTVSKTNLVATFNAGTSTDSDGTITSYVWNFGEASSSSNIGSGSIASHTYAAAGTYTVTLTVTDDQGATNVKTQSVVVTAANINPVARFTFNKNNLAVSFNGDASTDADGRVTNWVWNFGESSSSSNTATGSTVSHTYAAAGTYTVTLTVTDDQGSTHTATQSVAVTAANSPPTSSFTFVKDNLVVNFFGDVSSDPDGRITNYVWNFGDNVYSPTNNTASGSTGYHRYPFPGNYTVTLTVTDDQGATATSTQIVNVFTYNTRPTVLFTNLNDRLNVTFDASESFDPDGRVTDYQWNFGESSSSSNTASGMVVTHTYAGIGTYSVSLTVYDDQGAFRILSKNVVVASDNINPVAQITYLKRRLAVNFTGETSYDIDGSIATYSWNFGESSSANNTATGRDVSHTYAASGSYTVTLTVTDAEGATNTATSTVVVSNVNINPVATFTKVIEANAVTFSAVNSNDPDGTIVTYAWNFGEPSSTSNTASVVDPTHTYASTGSFTVTLTVTDDEGATNVYTSTVSISVVAGSGNLQITLTWSQSGDGDILVKTPNGYEISYVNRGPSASTDFGGQDIDTGGFGPENIFWATSVTPPSGTYYLCFSAFSSSYESSITPSTPMDVVYMVRRPNYPTLRFEKSFYARYRGTSGCSPTNPMYVGQFVY